MYNLPLLVPVSPSVHPQLAPSGSSDWAFQSPALPWHEDALSLPPPIIQLASPGSLQLCLVTLALLRSSGYPLRPESSELSAPLWPSGPTVSPRHFGSPSLPWAPPPSLSVGPMIFQRF
ncbi:hypothetical protein M9458_053458 [Cirrhinus mrigala]|uniref:Uncharacterized protein n=1 Tax=Cirrhinus mrigala TaxID=683832 RepID=A0ABD0MQ77_CIRMR